MKDGRPVVYGEVLFDCFPDGSRVLGGAPFNVAWHLQAFGHAPVFVSRVGQDESGDAVLERMRAHGMDTSCVQRDAAHPTGRVEVQFEDGQPRYTILDQQAYDHVDTASLVLPSVAAVIYHGSLALRHAAARSGFAELLGRVAGPRFVDVNLRAPWWQREHVRAAIRDAGFVKLNEDELLEIEDVGAGVEIDITTRARNMRQSYGIETLVVTRGKEGALLFDGGPTGPLDEAPQDDVEVVDTVGAGDALTSILLVGLLRGWSRRLALTRAHRFASAVCTLRGATTEDPEFYAAFLHDWTAS